MSKARTERIESIDAKIKQYQNERTRLLNLQKDAERKARTRRLIERGAILESLISDPAKLTNEQIKEFLEKTVATEYARNILSGITAQKDETAKTNPSWKVKPTNTSDTSKIADTEQGGG